MTTLREERSRRTTDPNDARDGWHRERAHAVYAVVSKCSNSWRVAARAALTAPWGWDAVTETTSHSAGPFEIWTSAVHAGRPPDSRSAASSARTRHLISNSASGNDVQVIPYPLRNRGIAHANQHVACGAGRQAESSCGNVATRCAVASREEERPCDR